MPAPRFLAEHAQRFVESGASAPSPRSAATVLLLRDAADGFEVYTQRRASTMAFAPNMYAFPGGSVDPRDAERAVGWAGPTPADWAGRLGLGEADAQAIVCAAVREVFEECGVLLAGPSGSTVVGSVAGPEWEVARQALLSREVSLVELLASRELLVRADLLAPWARWLTPEFEPRRFDTFFFLARLPAEQETRDVGGEADHTVWLRPGEAIRLPMLPPTRHTLAALAACADIDAALEASHAVQVAHPVMPKIETDADGTWLRLT